MNLVSLGISTVEQLKNCYVFYSARFDEKLLETCDEEPVNYREYEKELRKEKSS